MYQSIIDNDSHGYYAWMCDCDTDAAHGIIGEEHITQRYRRKRGATDRLRTIAHALDWGSIDFSRMEDRT